MRPLLRSVPLELSSTPDQFAAFMRAETAKYAKLIKEAGIKVK